MEENKTVIEKFIEDNDLNFEGVGSDLNGNCLTLAGFICYIVVGYSEGKAIIDSLKLPVRAERELLRIFDYAYNNNYRAFWDTPQAKELYTF
jgi:hypothetical protein